MGRAVAKIQRLLPLILSFIAAVVVLGCTPASASPLDPQISLPRCAYDVAPLSAFGPTTQVPWTRPARAETTERAVVKGGRSDISRYDAQYVSRVSRASMASKPGAIPEGSPSQFTRTEALSGRASARQVTEMAESMKANGWQGPPIKVVEANEKLYVVDGHHRLAAATQAGVKAPYQVVDPSTVIGPGRWSSLDDIVRDAGSVGPNRIRAK